VRHQLNNGQEDLFQEFYQFLKFIKKENVELKVIELKLDENLLKERVKSRNLIRDQWKLTSSGWDKFKNTDKILEINPLDHYLVDASQSINEYLPKVLEYITL